jgi:hypothetical protein
MAKTIIDTCVIKSSWFKGVILDLKSKNRVVFVFTRHRKMWDDVSKNEAYLKLFHYAKDTGRLLEVSAAECEAEIASIVSDPTWQGCPACDDQHIFALAAIAGVQYVFTDDKRIGECRANVRTSIGRGYCKFRLVHSLRTFERNRERIIA